MALGGLLGNDGKGPNVFHTVLMAIFGLAIAGGVAALALYQTIGSQAVSLGQLKVWGTLPTDRVSSFLNALKDSRPEYAQVTYQSLSPQSYYDEVVNAIAAGRGPDVIFIDNANLVAQAEKLYPLPYTSFDERTFRSSYVESGEIFLRPDGILAMPFALDPLVMYWNRDLFAAAGIANPPQYWDEVVEIVPRLAIVTQDQRVRQAAIAMGTYSNITNAKAIISLLWLQAGIPITQWGQDGVLRVVLSSQQDNNAAAEAVRFYASFADPLKTTYTWNPSLPSSRDMFLAGDLAMYFGFASEFDELRVANPNLNFDVAMVPQARAARRPVTYATVEGLSVPRASRNISSAFRAVLGMTDATALRLWGETTRLPPVHRTLLAEPPTDAVGKVWYYAALNSRSWLEPDPRQVDPILRQMLEDVASGRASVQEALGAARAALERSIPR